MTHLAPFSYINRLLTNVLLATWAMLHAWRFDRLVSFSWARIRSFSLQSIVALLLLLSQLLWIIYDIMVTHVKYAEGYAVGEGGEAHPTPPEDYTDHHAEVVRAADVTLNFAFTIKNSGLLLLLATFHQIASRSDSAESFMSSREFTFYKVWSVISVFAYIVVQQLFEAYAPAIWRTTGPQFLYNFELSVIVLLCQVTVRRLGGVIEGLPPKTMAARRLQYYTYLLHWVSALSVLDIVGLLVINVDAVSSEPHIYDDRLWTDFLSVLFSIGVSFIYVPAWLIVFPQSLADGVHGNTTVFTQTGTNAGDMTNSHGTPVRHARYLAGHAAAGRTTPDAAQTRHRQLQSQSQQQQPAPRGSSAQHHHHQPVYLPDSRDVGLGLEPDGYNRARGDSGRRTTVMDRSDGDVEMGAGALRFRSESIESLPGVVGADGARPEPRTPSPPREGGRPLSRRHSLAVSSSSNLAPGAKRDDLRAPTMEQEHDLEYSPHQSVQ